MTTDTVNPYPETTPATSNGAGRASLVIGIIIALVGVVQQLVSHFLPLIMSGGDVDVSTVSVGFGVVGAVLGVLALAGLILGIVGLGRPVGRAAAGAGTAIAATTLASVVLGFVLPLILSAVY